MKNSRSSCAAVLLLATSFVIGCSDRPTSLLDDDGGGGSGAGSTTDGGAPQGGSPGDGGAGATGGEGGEAPQKASFEISVDDESPEIELRDEVELTVTVAPNGYVGTVNLTLQDVPSDVTAELSSTTMTLDGSADETVTLTLASASDTTTGTFDFTLAAFSEDGTKQVLPSLTVLPVITVYIPMNLSSFNGMDTAFGPFPTTIKALPNMSAANPITVRFFNQDDVGHEIHADQGGQGFGHGIGSIAPNSFDPLEREVNSPGEYNYYPHDLNNNTIRGRIVIE
jgi:hypothetical protein